LFRRSKTETVSDAQLDREVGKGRPTPTRKEAEAAAKARAKASLDPKAARRGRTNARGRSVTDAREIREGMKRGDERYLPPRDQGPVRRFVRDFVDSRLNIAELTIPLLFVSLVASAAGQAGLGNGLLNATILVVVLDSAWLLFRMRRQLRQRFPDTGTKGTTFYALTRVLQLRFMRLPKPQVKLGQPLPDHYR
jgi:Protein of unknown function (DUF3043)